LEKLPHYDQNLMAEEDPTENDEEQAAPEELENSLLEENSSSPRSGSSSVFRDWLNRCLTIRDQPSQWERLVAGLFCIVLILLLWGFITHGEGEKRIVAPYTLPSLSEAVNSFPQLWFERALARGTVASLIRVLGGFLLAASIAIPLGVVAACFPRVSAFLQPVSVFGRNIPIAALIPITLVWFGLGETQKVMFIFIASISFIFFDTTNAVNGVSTRFLDTAYTLGAKAAPRSGAKRSALIGLIYAVIISVAVGFIASLENPTLSLVDLLTKPLVWGAFIVGGLGGFLVWFPIQSHQAIQKVIFPLALPDIVNSLRLLFGLAFGYIMLAEVINARHGLGSLINMSQRQGPREHIYLILIIISLLAFTIDRLVYWMQKRWFPYVE